jgi:hypothetical protein
VKATTDGRIADPHDADRPEGDDVAEPLTPAVHRGRRRTLIAVGAVVTVLALTAGWLVFGGQRAQQSSEEDARQRIAPAAGTTATTAAARAGDLLVAPAAGLYRYQGTGREQTSFPPLTEEQGPAMPGTVVPDADGCWRLQIDYNTHHWQSWTYCTANGELREVKSTSFSRRNLGGADIDNSSEFTCAPANVILTTGDQPGATRPQSCTGKGTFVPGETTSAGTTTVVGPEQVDVGDQRIPTMHVRYDLTYTGGQAGTETTDAWFATATGLLVRNERHIDVATDTPFGRITYVEDAALTLQTPAPV